MFISYRTRQNAHLSAGDGVPLGQDPASGKDVFVRDGPYGPYVQLGVTAEDKADPKPVRAPIKLTGCTCMWHLPPPTVVHVSGT